LENVSTLKGLKSRRKPRGNSFSDLCKTLSARVVASGLWPEKQGFAAKRSRRSLDATPFAEVSFRVDINFGTLPKAGRCAANLGLNDSIPLGLIG
jgi:hypothetical protein